MKPETSNQKRNPTNSFVGGCQIRKSHSNHLFSGNSEVRIQPRVDQTFKIGNGVYLVLGYQPFAFQSSQRISNRTNIYVHSNHLFQSRNIGIDHHLNQLFERYCRFPSKYAFCLRVIPAKKIHFSRAQEFRIGFHVV